MKRVALGALFCLAVTPLIARLNVDVSCPSAVLINGKTGKVLYNKNGTESMYPASTTKIAFALYAIKFHQALFNKQCAASMNAVKSMTESAKGKDNYSRFPSYILVTDASHMGLKVGEEMSFGELVEATMVLSADDASNVISEVMGNGSIDKCVEDVNRYLALLGLKETHFTNPHGLHHPDHVSTALDLARLSMVAMKDPLFRKMVSQPRFNRPKTNKQPAVQLQTTNRLLVKGCKAYYAPAIGVKTGYHSRAGHCFVAAAEQNGRMLIAVVLKCPSRDDRFRDVTQLFKAAFDEKKVTQSYLTAGPQSFVREMAGGKEPIQTYTEKPIALSYYPSEEPQTRCQLVWHDVMLPVQRGAPIGELRFFADSEPVQTVVLYAANGVDETFAHKLRRHLWLTLAVVAGVLVAAFYLLTRRRR